MLQHFSAASFKFLALCTLWVPSALPLRCCTFCPTSSVLYFCFREAYQPRNLPLTVADNPFATQGKRVARSRNGLVAPHSAWDQPRNKTTSCKLRAFTSSALRPR